MNFVKNLTKKKAIFLTLSLVLLALVLLSLSIIFLEQKRNENFITQAAIDRVTNLDLSLQKAITALFSVYGQTSIKVEGDKVIVQEQMPPSFSTFETKINDFKDFIEDNLDTLTIDTTKINTMELEFAPPLPITYDHDLINEKAIIKKIGILNAIEINFTFDEFGMSACPITWTGNDGNELILKIIAYNPITSDYCDSQKTIDISDTITAEIGALGKVKVELDKLEIIKQGTNPFTLKTTLEFPEGTEIVSIKMPEIVTNVSLLDVRIIGEARFITS